MTRIVTVVVKRTVMLIVDGNGKDKRTRRKVMMKLLMPE